MAASRATSSRRSPVTLRGVPLSGRPTVRGLSLARRALRNSPSSLWCTLLVIPVSVTSPATGKGGQFPPWIASPHGGTVLFEIAGVVLRQQITDREKGTVSDARSSAVRPRRRPRRGARGPDDRRADRRDHPAVGHLRLRVGPVALPRHRSRRRRRRRWATSTSASSRRSAPTVTHVKPGQFVVGSFFASDNTCEICRAGYQTSCVHRESSGAIGAQAELLRVPLADGTLVATPELPADDLIPQPAGRLRRAGHRLVRRRRRRGRPGQDRRGRR